MKKIFIVAAAALTTLVACQKNEVAPATDPIPYATIEETDATKTYMDANNNIRWSENDQVAAFMRSSVGVKYQVAEESVGKTSALFIKKANGSSDNDHADSDWNHNVVYYPYSETTKAAISDSNYAIEIALPSVQAYVSESFGNGSMAMVAVSEDNNITFNNILGGIKLQFKGNSKVKSINLQGKSNEKLSGAATVTAYADETKPAIKMASDASTSVTLNCGSGVQLNESTATEFIIALPPMLFSKGFIVSVTDASSRTYVVETDKSNTVLRSSLLVMPDVLLNDSLIEEQEDYWIDLGLPSGTLWAKYNVGASSPEEYGDFYAWGEIEDKVYYTWGSYDYKELFNYGSVPGSFYSGVYIGKEISNTTYDVAHIKWGDGARMPTLAELQELLANCSFKPGTYNEVSGNYVVGPNANSIFLPFSGYKSDDEHYSKGSIGCFWTGTYYQSNNDDAYSLTTRKDYSFIDDSPRYLGRSVRPVKDK